jgi:hypothetical protein
LIYGVASTRPMQSITTKPTDEEHVTRKSSRRRTRAVPEQSSAVFHTGIPQLDED